MGPSKCVKEKHIRPREILDEDRLYDRNLVTPTVKLLSVFFGTT
jgi:hypothetical protein